MNTELRKQIARLAVNVADDTLDYAEAHEHVRKVITQTAPEGDHHHLLDEAIGHFDWALREISFASAWLDIPDEEDDSSLFYLQPTLEELGYIVD